MRQIFVKRLRANSESLVFGSNNIFGKFTFLGFLALVFYLELEGKYQRIFWLF